MSRWLRLALRPPAAVGQVDTGLRFTDVLFGFVIRDLFLRLEDWSRLSWSIRWQLIVAAVLVLGSWIGFRRSIHRSQYEVKFFNLPFLMFIADQLMIIVYFRIATLTDIGGKGAPTPGDLATRTLELLVVVFILYGIWDYLGRRMANAREGVAPADRPKYPEIDDDKKMTDEPMTPSRVGYAMTVATLAVLALLWWWAAVRDLSTITAEWLLFGMIVILLLYRFAKEVRTSCELP